MSAEEDKVFFRNYAVVIVLLSIMIAVFLVIARIIGLDGEAVSANQERKAAVNTAVVGVVKIEGEVDAAAEVAAVDSAAAATGPVDGEKVYKGLCFSCHGANLANIPQVGDTVGWASRLEQGMPLLYEHAIVGYVGASGMPMPAKGGNPKLSDEEVKAAVDFMVENSQ